MNRIPLLASEWAKGAFHYSGVPVHCGTWSAIQYALARSVMARYTPPNAIGGPMIIVVLAVLLLLGVTLFYQGPI